MADFNYNWNDYGNWRVVQAPNGQKYYVLPGNEGYLYDPFLSKAKGRPVIFTNPESALAEKAAKEKAAKDAASPTSQLTNAAVPVVGSVVAKKAVDAVAGALTPEASRSGLTNAITAAKNAQTAGSTAAAEAANAGNTANTSTGALNGLGSAAPYLGVLGAGLGAYGMYNATQIDSKRKGALAGGMSGFGFGSGIGAMAPLLGFGPLGWAALLGMGGIGALLGGGLGLTAHKTTKQREAEMSQYLAGMSPDDQRWQQYVSGMRNQEQPGKGENAFHGGQYATWDEYKQAGLDAADLTGVAGNMQTFGPEWAGYSFDQQKKITQALIDNDLYKNKWGDVIVSDAERAKQIRDQVMAGSYEVPKKKDLGAAAAEAFAGDPQVTKDVQPATEPVKPAAPGPWGQPAPTQAPQLGTWTWPGLTPQPMQTPAPQPGGWQMPTPAAPAPNIDPGFNPGAYTPAPDTSASGLKVNPDGTITYNGQTFRPLSEA